MAIFALCQKQYVSVRDIKEIKKEFKPEMQLHPFVLKVNFPLRFQFSNIFSMYESNYLINKI